MPRREWDEMDEQMEREGQARIRSMRSVGQLRRNRPSREKLLPGQARVPMKGSGGGEAQQSLGQQLWATNYAA